MFGFLIWWPVYGDFDFISYLHISFCLLIVLPLLITFLLIALLSCCLSLQREYFSLIPYISSFPDLEIFIQLTPCTCSFGILYALRRLSLYHLFHSWIIIVLDFYNKHTHCSILIITFTVFFLVKRREIIIKLLKFTKSRYISQSSTRRQQLLYKNLNKKILICKEQRIGILKGWLVE